MYNKGKGNVIFFRKITWQFGTLDNAAKKNSINIYFNIKNNKVNGRPYKAIKKYNFFKCFV